MFTGIITDIGEVTAITPIAKGKRLVISCHFDMDCIPIGASIACDGACMTVVEKTTNSFAIEISPESLDKTTLGTWQVGTNVNLERPVAVGGEFGGHFVTGHVDAVGNVISFEEVKGEASRPSEPSTNEVARHGRSPLPDTGSSNRDSGRFYILTISYPKGFGTYLAEKGSVAVNGVSLTVNSVNRTDKQFSLMVIPHTLEQTNLGKLSEGSPINLEADLIARYLLAQKQEQEAS